MKTKNLLLAMVAATTLNLGLETLNSSAQLAVSTSSNTTICSGQTTNITSTVTGGATPYNYNWSPATGLSCTSCANPTAFPAITTTYTVLVTDAIGVDTVQASVIITVFQSPVANAGSDQTVFCSGDSVTIGGAPTASGGITPYTFTWNPINYLNSTFVPNPIAYPSITTNYTVVVTDGNGCSAMSNVTINVPPVLSLSLTPTNVICNGGNNGSIYGASSGGTPPYYYSWSTMPVQTSATATGLIAGTYTLTITDANFCTISDSVIITEPPLFTFSIDTFVNVSCLGGSDGSIFVTGYGGTGPYQYSSDSGVSYQAFNVFNGLFAGTYSVIIKDANNCTLVTPAQIITITEPASFVSFSTAHTNVFCNGGNNGSITITASGGTGALQYSKDNGSSWQSSNIFLNLIAGTYQTVVKDSNNCIASSQSVIISEPSALTLPVAQTNVNCNGGSDGTATANPVGGTSPFTFFWSTTATTQAVSGLTLGSYSVTVTDSLGCTIQSAISITEPAILSLSATTTNPICTNNNGSADVTPDGGTAPYSFIWSTSDTIQSITGLFAGTYSITITDGNGCTISDSVTLTTQFPLLSVSPTITNASCYNNDGSININPGGGTFTYSFLWSNSSTTQNISGIGSGTYSVTVTDGNGCTITDSVLIDNSIAPSSIPICMVTVDSTSTKNVVVWEKPISAPIDSFRVYREFGLNNYAYIGSVAYSALSEFTDITGGVNPKIQSYRYKISVLDTCGNESALSAHHRTIHLSTPQFTPPKIFDLIWTNDYEGFTISGYNILRDGNNTGIWDSIGFVTFGNFSYTDLNAPSANAAYLIEAAHPTGCTAGKTKNYNSSKSNTSSISSAGTLAATATSTNATFGNCDGTATVNATGGAPPYTYSWNTTPTQTDQTAAGLCAGNYSATVTDSSGNTATATATVGTIPGILEFINGTDALNIYPNPYSGLTQISYTLTKDAKVKIEVYNIIGGHIITLTNEHQTKGVHEYKFGAVDIGYPNGVYVVKLIANDNVFTKRLVEFR